MLVFRWTLRGFLNTMGSMSDSAVTCPECESEHTYELDALLVCSMCAHEWNPDEDSSGATSEVRDAVGNVLTDGDAVIVIRDLKVKGSAGGIKSGTKVRSIRLVEPVDGHDIDCRVDGFGRMKLKSSVVKKA